MELGTATANPGELATGYLPVTDLPTGGEERLPVAVVEGEHDGPTLWVTAGIHGDEVTGLAAAQDVVGAAEDLVADLRGTLVCLPNLNPAGLRRQKRTSYYDGDDPNRYFPDPTDDSTRPPRVQELVDERVYETFADDADALIDLHTAGVGSVPFAIRDRVLYGEVREEDAARELADELAALVEAFGLPIVNEYPAEEYLEERLQRSTAGAALNAAGIPAFTPELGSHSVVEDDARAAAVAGVFRVAVEMGLLDSVPADVAAADPGFESPVDYPVRRAVHPRTETAGIARHRVEAGDVVEAGDPVADVVSPHGDHRATVESDHDGYVLGRSGAAVYENDALAFVAVRDEGELVVPRDEGDDEA